MFEYFVSEHFAPMLKKQGFKKKNFIWNKHDNGFVHVVSLQKSRFSENNEDSFTINIGVFDPVTWHLCWGVKHPVFIGEGDCFPRARIGFLLARSSGVERDYWWACNEDTDIAKLAEEIFSIFDEVVFQFLSKMSDLREIVNYCNLGSLVLMPIDKIYLAIVIHRLGDKIASEELLEEVSCISKSWSNRVKNVRLLMA